MSESSEDGYQLCCKDGKEGKRTQCKCMKERKKTKIDKYEMVEEIINEADGEEPRC